jgi:hypothetical protein
LLSKRIFWHRTGFHFALIGVNTLEVFMQTPNRIWTLYLGRKSARLCSVENPSDGQAVSPTCLELLHPKMQAPDVSYFVYLASQVERFCGEREDGLSIQGDPELVNPLLAKLRPRLLNKARASATELEKDVG